MTSQLDQQTIAMHILPNISRSKENQTIKFGHLIEYNMRKTFVENSYPKCAGVFMQFAFFYANLGTIEI